MLMLSKFLSDSNLAGVAVVSDFAAAHVRLVAFPVVEVAAFRTVRISAVIFWILKMN